MRNIHNNNFSILHWLGFTLVVLGHQYVLMGQNPPFVLDSVCHDMGIKILFIVSGYLVTKSYQHTNTNLLYIKKRIKRIFPPLILCVLAVAVIIGPMITTKGMQSYFRGTWNYIYRNILLYPTYSLPGIFKGNPVSQAVNGSLWSLPIEFFCYIVIMMIGTVIRFIKKYSIVASKIICICVFAGVYLLYYLYGTGVLSGQLVIWGTDWFYACSIFIYFAAGSFVAALSLEKICVLSYGTLALIVYMILPEMFYMLKPLLFSYFIMSFALNSANGLSRVLDHCNYYYAGYLWAFPIQQMVIAFLMVDHSVDVNPIVVFGVCYVLIVGAAYVSTNIIEKIEKEICFLHAKGK